MFPTHGGKAAECPAVCVLLFPVVRRLLQADSAWLAAVQQLTKSPPAWSSHCPGCGCDDKTDVVMRSPDGSRTASSPCCTTVRGRACMHHTDQQLSCSGAVVLTRLQVPFLTHNMHQQHTSSAAAATTAASIALPLSKAPHQTDTYRRDQQHGPNLVAAPTCYYNRCSRATSSHD